jgi:uroporphyrinogen decarboxylase
MSTLRFYFDSTSWLEAYRRAHEDLAGALLIPDAWVELGMAAEPSAFGCPIRWHRHQPPDVLPHPGGLAAVAQAPVPDVERDGLLPVILEAYERLAPMASAAGFPPRMAAARGPLAVAAHLLGPTEFLLATQLERTAVHDLLERTTELVLLWLSAQLTRMREPVGILLLDDVVGLLGPEDAAELAIPRLRRIFAAFPHLLRVYHNDTPNPAVYDLLRDIGMDMFNFSHEVPIGEARQRLGPDVVLMGNLPPVDLLVRGTPEQVRNAVQAWWPEAVAAAPAIVSAGGGVSPGTPVENLRAVIETVRELAG